MTLASGDLTIAICQRCNFQFPYKDLSEDPNIKGLRVCCDCKDDYDPWRLAPPQPDPLQLRWPRPDVPLNVPDEVTLVLGTETDDQALWTEDYEYLELQ